MPKCGHRPRAQAARGLFLFHNNRDGTFTEVAAEAGITRPISPFASWFWDYDNDGALDLFVNASAGPVAVLSYYATTREVHSPRAGFVRCAASEDSEQWLEFEMPGHFRGDGRGAFVDVAHEQGLTFPSKPMGANFGEALTAAAAFVVTLRLLPPARDLSWPRLLLSLAALLVLVTAALFVLDATRPAEQRTHIGQLVERLQERGIGEGAMLLLEVARRKSLMNLRLITSPIALKRTINIRGVGASAVWPISTIRAAEGSEKLSLIRPGKKSGDWPL